MFAAAVTTKRGTGAAVLSAGRAVHSTRGPLCATMIWGMGNNEEGQDRCASLLGSLIDRCLRMSYKGTYTE